MNGYQYSRLWAYFSVKNNLMRNCSSKITRCLELNLKGDTNMYATFRTWIFPCSFFCKKWGCPEKNLRNTY